MYWSYNKKTKEPAFLTSMRKVEAFTNFKYDALAHQFGRNQVKELENDDFYISKCNSIEEAMIGFSEKVSEKVDFQYIGDFRSYEEGKEIVLKVFSANKFEPVN